MFESSKIKRILSQFSAENEHNQKELIKRLISFGEIAVPLVTEELRLNRILYADASRILQKLYNKQYLPTFIKGLGDNKENVRLLFREILAKSAGRSIVPQLTESLEDENHMVRRQVAGLLAELADPSIAVKIIPLLKHDNREVKKAAMDVLTTLKSPETATALFPLLDDPDSWTRRKAVEAICKLKDESTVDKLVSMLSVEKDPGIQKIILNTLGEIATAGVADAAMLYIKNPDMVIRQKAVEVVIKTGDSSIIPNLVKYLGDDDVNIRRCAVEILNGLKDTKTASALVNALKDGDWWVREIATDALSELGGSKISQLIMGLLRDNDEGIRRSAVEFFCRVKEPMAYDNLVRLLDDKDWWVREKAITALGLIGDPKAIAEISRLIGDREVIWAIPKALGKIGGKRILEPLSRLLGDKRKQVRLEALTAVANVDGEEALDYIKWMARDSEEGIQAFALKTLRDKTGKIWLVEDVEKDLEKLKHPSGAIVSRTLDAKPGVLLSEAILVVDIANSTDIANLYGDNLAMEIVNELGAIILPVSEKEGLLFEKSTGDGFLMTFPSTLNAVNVAVETLNKTIDRNGKVDRKRRLILRFAINMGETRVGDSGDRLGLAVNMAFRMEGVRKEDMMPAPGGMRPEDMTETNRILLTETVYQELSNQMAANTRLVGFFELKGFTGLHRVYELTPPSFGSL